LQTRTLALWRVPLTRKYTPTSTLSIDTKGKFFFNQHTESRRKRMSYIRGTIKRKNTNRTGHTLRRNYLIKDMKKERGHGKTRKRT
jgi:hypothetical protein